MKLDVFKKLNEDEEELLVLIICSGLGEILPVAHKRFCEKGDKDTFFTFLREITDLLDKIGYDFSLEMEEE